MNAVVEQKEPQLPQPVARRGINEPQWRTLVNNLYPGADVNSVLMVWDYCVARKLDPLKKPCHIVPMLVKDSKSGDYIWRDVVMPGIYEYRTTATRTGLYLGHSKPVYGPEVDWLGVKAPEWCEITVYRWNNEAGQRAEYPVQLKFAECAATKKDKKTGEYFVNDRWSKAPQQMLTKCAEAAALREAFPDELGGTHTADEMEGQIEPITVEATATRLDPRGDINLMNEQVRPYFNDIVDLLNQDKDEIAIADDLRRYEAEKLQPFPELYISVLDMLAKEKVISKGKFKEYLKIGLDRGGTHT